MKLLIIDDDKNIASFLCAHLSNYGFAGDLAHCGETAIKLARSTRYDLVILDLNLPDMRGGAVIDCLKNLEHIPPILLITVVGDPVSKAELINAGADDYLVKPFTFEELLARCRALLRRGQKHISHILKADDVTLDPYSQMAWRGEVSLGLTRKEFDILEYLLRNTGRVVSRSEIAEHVWDSSSDPFSASVDTHLGNLRKKLGSPDVIKTIHGRGCLIDAGYSERVMVNN